MSDLVIIGVGNVSQAPVNEVETKRHGVTKTPTRIAMIAALAAAFLAAGGRGRGGAADRPGANDFAASRVRGSVPPIFVPPAELASNLLGRDLRVER